jgi:hypothetical protein
VKPRNPYSRGRTVLGLLELLAWIGLVIAAAGLVSGGPPPFEMRLLWSALTAGGSLSTIAFCRIGLAVFDIAESTTGVRAKSGEEGGVG